MNGNNNQQKLFIIFDIETLVEDELLKKAAKKNQLERYNDENDEDYVPPAVYHLPVCISYLITNNGDFKFKNREKFVFKSFFSKDPSKVVDLFFKVLYKAICLTKRKDNPFLPYPILVSHNGIKFDLPVLVMRAIKYYENLSEESKSGLKEFLDESDKWEKERANYRSKYSIYNLDTFYYFYSSLKSIALLWGLESKTFMDGSEVERFYKDGRFEEIAFYCAEDVLTLGRILNKLLIAKGDAKVALPKEIQCCKVIIE